MALVTYLGARVIYSDVMHRVIVKFVSRVSRQQCAVCTLPRRSHSQVNAMALSGRMYKTSRCLGRTCYCVTR